MDSASCGAAGHIGTGTDRIRARGKNLTGSLWFYLLFFFFQAEDGIRDRDVTGVQTCALPILPMYMLATRPQNSAGFSGMKSGPGLNPHRTSAASRTAVVPEPGMPRVSSGTSAPPVSELFAPSGAATPSTTPVPNRSRRREPAFSRP